MRTGLFLFPGRDGERHYLFSVTPIRGHDSHLTGIVLLLRDVTRLTEVERTKSEFVSAAAHELRTPLTGIEMSIELLMEQVSRFEDRDVELLRGCPGRNPANEGACE